MKPHGGTVSDVAAMFDRIRSENASEPLWRGVVSTTPTAEGLVFQFAEPAAVPLRTSGVADVACVLYPPDGGAPSAPGLA